MTLQTYEWIKIRVSLSLDAVRAPRRPIALGLSKMRLNRFQPKGTLSGKPCFLFPTTGMAERTDTIRKPLTRYQ